jgi:ABC-2 type transport system permease protein
VSNRIRNILAIAGKEARSYYGSPVAWVLMGFYALIQGVFFTAYLSAFMDNAMRGQFGGAPASSNVNLDLIAPLLSNASVIILFILPMVTMRTYSEEKRAGTIELLLTSPITDLDIILGKFLGSVGLYSGLLAVSLVFVLLLYGFGTPAFLPVVSGYVGLMLLGASFVALGLFISSTTKNQMVAGAVTFIVLLLFWIIAWLADRAGPTFGPLLSYLSITGHFEDFAKGVIDTKHVIFYLSFIAFGLFLTLKSVDSERWRG